MSGYRRLISYIYAYEGGVKGKNLGFAKVEVRGEQCRIYVSVKNIYVGSNDIGVYLLAPGAEILLGRIFVRGGAGEFRIGVNSLNIEGSGCSMEACYGLTIHDVESTWQCYTTIWEDAVTQAAETVLADVTSEQVRSEQAAEPDKASCLPISAEIERELAQEEEQLEAQAPWEPENAAEPEVIETALQVAAESVPPTPSEIREPEPAESVPPTPREIREPEPAESVPPEPWEIREPEPAESVPPEPREIREPEPAESMQPPEPEDAAVLQELDRQEQEELVHKPLWNQLQRRYTKVLAFNYDNGCEILSIKPQDIGLLPRDIWALGNNSFLLHGYYNYRHLILARLNNPQGEPRYLIGVPGHYFSNEKYMASMFGFPHFVLARKQPENDGRFGYWYTDIRL